LIANNSHLTFDAANELREKKEKQAIVKANNSSEAQKKAVKTAN
jgi:hypothetical protein